MKSFENWQKTKRSMKAKEYNEEFGFQYDDENLDLLVYEKGVIEVGNNIYNLVIFNECYENKNLEDLEKILYKDFVI